MKRHGGIKIINIIFQLVSRIQIGDEKTWWSQDNKYNFPASFENINSR